MKRVVLGMVAHVDAGKTTLTEALLYVGGKLQKMGRVDKQNAFLDTSLMEKERGITIFSKQAVFAYKDMEVTLVDTPGHVDFGPEMERALQILDYAILVINGAEGIQAHTRTLWHLLKRYAIPVFLFVNKMDQISADRDGLWESLCKELTDSCIDFSEDTLLVQEQAAMTDEAALNEFLETGQLQTETMCRLISERKVFPCFFGSALKVTGIKEFLTALSIYTKEPAYPKDFGAKVYKIMRDGQGNRLTCLKVTGGVLKVKSCITENTQDKVNQIRIYSGEKFEAVQELPAGAVCAVTGLSDTKPGQGLGFEALSDVALLEPVLTYKVILPEGLDAAVMLPKLRILEEESPELHVVWDEVLQEILVSIMGEVQLEILKRLILERFQIEVNFGQGNVIYKETISEPVVGMGHFEPLKHYAEVHILMEPSAPGSGMSFSTACSEDILGRNWQRLILTHLEEKEHKGVLIGAGLTDVSFTLITGRAHLKHTEGGDFRQATYRAVRQGLMKAKSVLLEPYYAFSITVPEKMTGRVMTDLEQKHGSFEQPRIQEGRATIVGRAPVVTMRTYQKELTAFTHGEGYISFTPKGYYPCHNTEEVVCDRNYDPESDLHNPSASVFCAHGAGYPVPWYEAEAHMHVQSDTDLDGFHIKEENDKTEYRRTDGGGQFERVIGQEEIDHILSRTYHANKREQASYPKWHHKPRESGEQLPGKPYVGYKPIQKREEYLLVDGYNVIHAWEELKNIAETTMDGARGRLLDILCDYQAVSGFFLIVVFDAYRVKGHETEALSYHNIHVVYTKEAETADQYIEKFAHENGHKYRVIVATSDGLEQIIIRGQGCELLSARDLLEDVKRTQNALREGYLKKDGSGGFSLELPNEIKDVFY